MWKTKQDRSFSKIWTFDQDLCKSQPSGNWTIYTISESWTKKWIPKSKCTRKTEWNRPVLKILTFWPKSKIQLDQSFFLFLFYAGNSNRVIDSGQVQETRSSWKWKVTSLMTSSSYASVCNACEGSSGAWKFTAARVGLSKRVAYHYRHVWAHELTLMNTKPSSGAWWCFWGRFFWVLQIEWWCYFREMKSGFVRMWRSRP